MSIDQNPPSVLSELSDSSFVGPLHSDLLKVWDSYKKYGMDNIIDTAICYYIGFHSYEEDSLVSISFKNCKGKYPECKGIAIIDGYYVAVLDPENIGKDFYNGKLLIQKDISELKCGTSKLVKGKVVGGSGYITDEGGGGIVEFIHGLCYKLKNNKIEFSEDYRDEEKP